MNNERPEQQRPAPGSESPAWWRNAVGYEVYIRSFADGNDDGVGDLVGLTARLEYLAWLGIEIVWITPFYSSPMVDFGYDVADYMGVDPTFGSLDDFDALIAEANRLGLRVVIDIVPNHTSDQHPWFRAARSAPDDPKRDYYHWRPADPNGELPNNWVSYFGGPAWSTDDVSGEQYLHLFFKEQPDLNWSNPAVVAEFDAILRFWLDRGVSGFRIDVAQALAKDAELRSNPEITPWNPEGSRWEQWDAFDHRHDILQPETLEIFRRWRGIVEEYGAVLIGETYVVDPSDLAGLLPGDGLHVGFWMQPMHVDWSVDQIDSMLRAPIEAGAADVGWVLASHDEPRPPTRFGGGETGVRRALALSTMLLGLPGLPFIYQGEELAIEDGIVPTAMKADPVGGDDVGAGRDGCRTPIPWSTGPGAGFTSAAEPWLPISHDDPAQTVDHQRVTEGSPLLGVRRLVALRRELDPETPIEWFTDRSRKLVGYRRGDHDFLLNMGDAAIELDDERGRVAHSSRSHGSVGLPAAGYILHADEAVVITHE